MSLYVKRPYCVLINASLFQAIESAQAAQDVKIRFDSFQQQFQEVCSCYTQKTLSFLYRAPVHSQKYPNVAYEMRPICPFVIRVNLPQIEPSSFFLYIFVTISWFYDLSCLKINVVTFPASFLLNKRFLSQAFQILECIFQTSYLLDLLVYQLTQSFIFSIEFGLAW